MDERTFDYTLVLDELRCRETDWLQQHRDALIREQRRLHVEELAVLRVLDERGAIDDTSAQRDGVSVRELRRKRLTADHLADLPHVADAAARGDLSEAQLDHISDLADGATDREWAEEGPRWSPRDLADRARAERTPTMEDFAARRAARELRYWWNRDTGMLDGRFSLPDLDGARFEMALDRMIDRMKPERGAPWDTRARRGADALVELCGEHTDASAIAAPTPLLIVQVPMRGPATVAGIPLPDAVVEGLRAQAKVEPVLVDGDGEPVVVGRIVSVLPEKTKRVVKQRDGRCRWPGCDHRVGLQVHHLWPRSWGGTDAIWNLAAVCAIHHVQLAPQGDVMLLGNPNNPAGLALVHRDELATLAADRARAGPDAA